MWLTVFSYGRCPRRSKWGWMGAGGEGVFGVCIVGSARLCATYRKSTLNCLIQLIKIRKGRAGGGGRVGLSLTRASLIGRIFASFKTILYKASGLLALLYLAQWESKLEVLKSTLDMAWCSSPFQNAQKMARTDRQIMPLSSSNFFFINTTTIIAIICPHGAIGCIRPQQYQNLQHNKRTAVIR